MKEMLTWDEVQIMLQQKCVSVLTLIIYIQGIVREAESTSIRRKAKQETEIIMK